VLRYFVKKMGTACGRKLTAVYCCDLVRVFVITTASANMKYTGSGLFRGIEMVLNAIKIILLCWCHVQCHPLMKRVK